MNVLCWGRFVANLECVLCLSKIVIVQPVQSNVKTWLCITPLQFVNPSLSWMSCCKFYGTDGEQVILWMSWCNFVTWSMVAKEFHCTGIPFGRGGLGEMVGWAPPVARIEVMVKQSEFKSPLPQSELNSFSTRLGATRLREEFNLPLSSSHRCHPLFALTGFVAQSFFLFPVRALAQGSLCEWHPSGRGGLGEMVGRALFRFPIEVMRKYE